MLVDWGCERADEHAWIAFVEASPLGRRLYESKGFVTTEVVNLAYDAYLDKETIQYFFMVRPATKATSSSLV